MHLWTMQNEIAWWRNPSSCGLFSIINWTRCLRVCLCIRNRLSWMILRKDAIPKRKYGIWLSRIWRTLSIRRIFPISMKRGVPASGVQPKERLMLCVEKLICGWTNGRKPKLIFVRSENWDMLCSTENTNSCSKKPTNKAAKWFFPCSV